MIKEDILKMKCRSISKNQKAKGILFKLTQDCPDFYSLRTRYEALKLGFYPVCECGHFVKFTGMHWNQFCSLKCSNNSLLIKEKIKVTNIKKYGIEYPLQLDSIKEQIKNTNLQRYGVENPVQSNQIKIKIKETNQKKYGGNAPACSKEVQDKIKYTCQERYNGDSPFQSDSIKEKINKTKLERYGIENHIQSEQVKEKIKQTMLIKHGGFTLQSDKLKEKVRQTCIERYGIDNPIQLEEVRKQIRLTNLNKYGVENFNQKHIPKEFLTQDWWDERTNFIEAKELIGHYISESKIYLKAHQFRPDWKFNGFISQPHQRILVLLDQYNIQYNINDRLQIKPYELDIWIPSKFLAIEVNGVYWHTEEKGKGESYHQMKTQMCKEKGITLFHFSDVEIEQDWNKIIKQITSFL